LSARPDFVLVFTSTDQTHDRTAANHDDRTPQAPCREPLQRGRERPDPRVREPRSLW